MEHNALNFDLFALADPKNRDDLLLLADEACNELRRIRGHWESLFEECPADA